VRAKLKSVPLADPLRSQANAKYISPVIHSLVMRNLHSINTHTVKDIKITICKQIKYKQTKMTTKLFGTEENYIDEETFIHKSHVCVMYPQSMPFLKFFKPNVTHLKLFLFPRLKSQLSLLYWRFSKGNIFSIATSLFLKSVLWIKEAQFLFDISSINKSEYRKKVDKKSYTQKIVRVKSTWAYDAD